METSDFLHRTWTDPWFRKLTHTEQLFFIYCWTNSHMNTAALYNIDIETIAFETKLIPTQIRKIINEKFKDKILFDEKNAIMWVVNYVKNQWLKKGNFSHKLIPGIERSLHNGIPPGHPFVIQFLQKYNTIPIQYAYSIDTSLNQDEYCIDTTGKGGIGIRRDIYKHFEKFISEYPKGFYNKESKFCPFYCRDANIKIAFERKSDEEIEAIMQHYPVYIELSGTIVNPIKYLQTWKNISLDNLRPKKKNDELDYWNSLSPEEKQRRLAEMEQKK